MFAFPNEICLAVKYRKWNFKITNICALASHFHGTCLVTLVEMIFCFFLCHNNISLNILFFIMSSGNRLTMPVTEKKPYKWNEYLQTLQHAAIDAW